MARHLIPIDSESGLWSRDIRLGFGRFINKRNEQICQALEEEGGIRLFRREVLMRPIRFTEYNKSPKPCQLYLTLSRRHADSLEDRSGPQLEIF